MSRNATASEARRFRASELAQRRLKVTSILQYNGSSQFHPVGIAINRDAKRAARMSPDGPFDCMLSIGGGLQALSLRGQVLRPRSA